MGTRWLLYDAGCSVCAALAREVEALSGGRLRVRSLREPEVQALLDQRPSRLAVGADARRDRGGAGANLGGLGDAGAPGAGS
jgi:predicted DCC family thiol-disulfide oxidoreductase YuxK